MSGLGSCPAFDGIKQFSIMHDKVWLFPKPCEPHINVLDGELTLKSSRGSSWKLWLLRFCPESDDSSTWLSPAKSPIWDTISLLFWFVVFLSCLSTQVASIGARQASSAFWQGTAESRRSRWYFRISSLKKEHPLTYRHLVNPYMQKGNWPTFTCRGEKDFLRVSESESKYKREK